jgi:hypothetical protein
MPLNFLGEIHITQHVVSRVCCDERCHALPNQAYVECTCAPVALLVQGREQHSSAPTLMQCALTAVILLRPGLLQAYYELFKRALLSVLHLRPG